MKKLSFFIVVNVLLGIGIIFGGYSYKWLLVYLSGLVILEIASYILIMKLREDFQWLITPKDELPELNKDGVEKFIRHGYDAELGWVRKANTQKEEIGKEGITRYSINEYGARKNPRHEKLDKVISCYGDSFAFGRQVNDNQTWVWYLSELTKTDVVNFAVGNYGLDQALLRLKREYPKNKTRIVIMGVVPSTIVRILCMWKHYSEFGNTSGFKPRFILKEGKLELVKNPIDTEDKLFKYKDYLARIREYDYFYETKFKREMMRFPYFVSILSNPTRNIPLIFLVSWYKLVSKKEEKKHWVYPPPMKKIMQRNLKTRYALFKNNGPAVKLLEKLVEEFVKEGKEKDFIPVFLWMPQKNDLLFVRDKIPYYARFIRSIKERVNTIDLTDYLVNRKDLGDIYSEDSKYGGHYSNFGNSLIAGIVHKELRKLGHFVS